MKNFILLISGMIFLVMQASAQETDAPVQSVKGLVRIATTQQPVAGASIRIEGTKLGAVAKSDGSFRISRVPVGRHTLIVSMIGFETMTQNIVVTSGKELTANFELTEKFTKTEEVTVSAERGRGSSLNENVLISSTVFSVDDAYRYAGSRGDPARMAQNYAGVLGVNDQRNDIIVRGGSPTELLWRFDGLDIPNPNHFATQGATGGPISILNINLLDNSDFITGAFPAEYGDKLSGVFDLHTRRGNSDKYEYLGQFGFNGFELMAEGPTPGVDGAFIANYRYSFLGLMDQMGINLGWAGIPKYQDANFKLDLEAGDKDRISVSGLYGTSDIFLDMTKIDSVFTGDRNIKNGTDLFAVAANWTHLFSDKVFGVLTVGNVYSRYRTDVDSITTDAASRVLGLDKVYTNFSTEGYSTAKYRLNYAPNSRHYFSAGSEARFRNYDIDIRLHTGYFRKEGEVAINRMGGDGTTLHSLNFVNWNWRITEDLTSNLGAQMQYLDISGKFSFEPRLGLSYRITDAQSLNLGVGIYRQSQPLTAYFASERNKSLDFTQAIHYVAGYSLVPAQDYLVRLEGYYKDYSRVPVSADRQSAASMINAGSNFGAVEVEENLVNEGKARSYGAELTLMKNFSEGFYITATGSLVRQEFTGSDGIWRFGAFDNRYIGNLLAGYEWKISPSFAIELSGKFTYAGGAPYTPVDLEKSRRYGRTFIDESRPFSERNPDYTRLDGRIDFRNNFEGWSMISFISVENILNRQNVSFREYFPRSGTVQEAHQLGFFPVGGIKIEF